MSARWERHRSYGVRDTVTGSTLWCYDANQEQHPDAADVIVRTLNRCDDIYDLLLAVSRKATDTGMRHALDDVIAGLGFTEEEIDVADDAYCVRCGDELSKPEYNAVCPTCDAIVLMQLRTDAWQNAAGPEDP